MMNDDVDDVSFLTASSLGEWGQPSLLGRGPTAH